MAPQYLPPVFNVASRSLSTPDDHFTAGPDCRVNASASGRVGRAGGCPTIRAGIVSPAGVQTVAAINSAPNDHFTAGPDCRVTVSGRGRVGRAGGCPTIRAGIVSPAGVQIVHRHIHPKRSFHCRSRLPCDTHRAVGALVVLVAVQLSVLGIVSPAGVRRLPVPSTVSAPDDHFTAGPDCRVTVSGRGRVGRAGGCPTIRAGIVSPAGVRKHAADVISAPDDHFTAGPDCRVTVSGSGRVGRAGGCPTIRAGIVSPAGVQRAAVPSPCPPQTIISLPVQTAV